MSRTTRAIAVVLLVGPILSGLAHRTGEAGPDHPKQRKIVFQSEQEGTTEIYIMNPDGTDIQQLTQTPAGGKSAQPTWSPNGQNIAFCSNRHSGDKSYAIYVMNFDGSDIRRLTEHANASACPAWSPDGRSIIFDCKREVCVVDTQTTEVRRLTHTPGEGKSSWASCSAWSPDGRRIAFFSNRDGNQEIYVMDPDGSNIQQLTHTDAPIRNWHPAWSPDGEKLAFVSNRDGKAEIYLMDATGANVQRLTQTEGEGTGSHWPDWSRDGTQITFASNRDGNFEIYVMSADGSNVQRLTFNNSFEGHPDW